MPGWLQRLFGRAKSKRAGSSESMNPARWPDFLRRCLPLFGRLPPADRPRLLELMETFLGEKRFWGSQGLELTDEMKILVAAQACVLVLRAPHLGLYPRTSEVIL